MPATVRAFWRRPILGDRGGSARIGVSAHGCSSRDEIRKTAARADATMGG
jgi:hypothetical protein